MKKIKTLLLALAIVLVSAISILSDLIKFGITSDLFDTGYWVRTATVNASAVIIIFLANSIHKDKVMETNKTFTERKRALELAYADLTRQGLTEAFQRYIDADNDFEKLRVYRLSLSRKLERVKAKISSKETRFNAVRVWRRKPPENEPKTLALVYLRLKRQSLEQRQLNAENEYKYVRVRYTRVRYSDIFSESERNRESERDMFFHTGVHNVGIVVKKAILVLVFGVVSTLGVSEMSANFSLFTVYQMCMKVFTLVLALYTGFSDAEQFVGGKMCDTLARRLKYVRRFCENKSK